jgi:FixJ family two-component response regulator
LPTLKPFVIAVDDDREILRALRMQLRAAGFKVLVFNNGESLLRRKLPKANACLLLDVFMPRVNGIELYYELVAAGRELPLILMSARNDEEARRIMNEAKPAALLFKPFGENLLLAAIHKAIRTQTVKKSAITQGGANT